MTKKKEKLGTCIQAEDEKQTSAGDGKKRRKKSTVLGSIHTVASRTVARASSAPYGIDLAQSVAFFGSDRKLPNRAPAKGGEGNASPNLRQNHIFEQHQGHDRTRSDCLPVYHTIDSNTLMIFYYS